METIMRQEQSNEIVELGQATDLTRGIEHDSEESTGEPDMRD